MLRGRRERGCGRGCVSPSLRRVGSARPLCAVCSPARHLLAVTCSLCLRLREAQQGPVPTPPCGNRTPSSPCCGNWASVRVRRSMPASHLLLRGTFLPPHPNGSHQRSPARAPREFQDTPPPTPHLGLTPRVARPGGHSAPRSGSFTTPPGAVERHRRAQGCSVGSRLPCSARGPLQCRGPTGGPTRSSLAQGCGVWAFAGGAGGSGQSLPLPMPHGTWGRRHIPTPSLGLLAILDLSITSQRSLEGPSPARLICPSGGRGPVMAPG